jgi:hypothetical protein
MVPSSPVMVPLGSGGPSSCCSVHQNWGTNGLKCASFVHKNTTLGLNPSMKPPGCHPLAILLSKAGARISPCQGALQSSKSCCDLAVSRTKLVWEREWECNPTNSRQFLKKGTTLSFGCLIYCIHTKIHCYLKKNELYNR